MKEIKCKFKSGVFALLTILCVLAGSLPASAQTAWPGVRTDPSDYFAGVGTTISSNISYYVTPARAGSRGAVSFVSAWSDVSTASLKFYPITVDVLVTNALSSGLSNVLVAATNGIAVGDVIILRSVANDTYQKCIVGPTITAAGFVITNNLTSATTSFALAVGDHVYRCGTAASLLIGSTRTDYNGGGQGAVFYSQTGYPQLIEVSGLSSPATNNQLIVSGKFVR